MNEDDDCIQDNKEAQENKEVQENKVQENKRCTRKQKEMEGKGVRRTASLYNKCQEKEEG